MKTDKELKNEFNRFKLGLRSNIMTTRFSLETWSENMDYLSRNRNIGCIYCSPDPIRNSIAIDSVMFVLEMNNTNNRIMGLGMVKNHAVCGKYKVYSKDNYNRYVYAGNMRIDRDELSSDEEDIICVFESLCFKGSKHMKRGQGIKAFPLKLLFKCNEKLNINLVEKVSNMFKNRLNRISK